MIILGAGLAGLSAAFHTGGAIYEKDGEVGGHAKSKNLDGFVFDEGIHVLQTKDQKILDLFKQLGVSFQEHCRSGYVYSHDVFRPYPLQVNTAGLPYSLRAACVLGFMFANSSLTGRNKRDCKNYEDWLKHSLGKGFTKHFFNPYSEKFWTVHPREMTHEWAGLRVPQPSSWEVIKGALREQQTLLGTHVQFRYPLGGGFGSLAKAFEPHIAKIHFKKKVSRVSSLSKKLQFNGQEELGYKKLISTLPLPDLVAMIEDAPSEVRAAAARLRHNSIMVVNLGIDRGNLSDKHWIHFPEPAISFFRISFPSNFAPDLAPRGTSSVSAEVSYSPSARLDKSQVIDRVIDDLRRVGILRREDRVVLIDTVNIKYAYVIYDHHRKEAVRTIHDFLRKNDIYPCGRYGSWAYFWSDEAVLSGRKAAELATRHGNGGSSPE